MDSEKLKALLLKSLLFCWKDLTDTKANEGIYAFTLYTCSEGLYAFASCSTHMSLAERAKFLGLSQSRIKWSPCDWKYHRLYQPIFSDVENFLSEGWSEDFSDYRYGSKAIIECYRSALRQFVNSPAFAEHPLSRDVFVGILKGDQSLAEIEELSVNVPEDCDIF